MGCVACILANRKGGKQERFLNPIHKEEVPLYTYHIDHLGPLGNTNKIYKHILVVVDTFKNSCGCILPKQPQLRR